MDVPFVARVLGSTRQTLPRDRILKKCTQHFPFIPDDILHKLAMHWRNVVFYAILYGDSRLFRLPVPDEEASDRRHWEGFCERQSFPVGLEPVLRPPADTTLVAPMISLPPSSFAISTDIFTSKIGWWMREVVGPTVDAMRRSMHMTDICDTLVARRLD